MSCTICFSVCVEWQLVGRQGGCKDCNQQSGFNLKVADSLPEFLSTYHLAPVVKTNTADKEKMHYQAQNQSRSCSGLGQGCRYLWS